MAIEISRPVSRDAWLAGRKSSIGASEIAALFGAHQYLTPFELWANKSGQYEREFKEIEIRESSIHLPPHERGNFLESKAFDLAMKLRPGWIVATNQIPGGEVFVDTAARIASTPDAFILDAERPDQRGALQVKSIEGSVFRRTWMLPDGAIEPPVAVAIQAIADATLSGCDFAYAAAMVVGFGVDFYLVEVPLHAKLMAKARELTADFWRRIEANEPYAPEFARDGAVIASLWDSDDGSEIDLSGNSRITEILELREHYKAVEKAGGAAAEARGYLDAELIFALKNAARGRLADGRMIEAKTTRRKGFAVEDTSFRVVRIKEAK